MKMMSLLLIIFASVFQGVIYSCAKVPEAIYVREGEAVLLRCPPSVKTSGGKVFWQRSTLDHWELHGHSNSSLGLEELKEEKGRPILTYRDKLWIFNVSRSDQGLYACSQRIESGALRNGWFNLTVYRGKCYTEEDLYPLTRSVGESVTITCPLPDVPPHEYSNTSWMKDCRLNQGVSKNKYIRKLALRDDGYYTCTRSYWNGTKMERVDMSKTIKLTVKDVILPLDPQIIHPTENELIEVDVGKEATVLCTAVFHYDPEFEILFWLNGTSIIETDQNKPVFYNNSMIRQGENEWHTTATLVLKNVSQEHLDKKYTCKLQSTIQKLINVSITLTKRECSTPIQSHFLWLAIVGVFVFVTSVITVIYVKLKIDIVLFLRDLRSGPYTVTEGKTYDAYIMCYETSEEEALSEEDRRCILSVLETEYGYQLCIYERDVVPGTAVADAVLESIGQSQRLILVPSALEQGHEGQYGLLSGLHAALVDRQTQLILIERAPRSELDSLPESLRLLARSSGTVTWKDGHSGRPSSAFWKKLRYRMPARQRPQRQPNKVTIL